MLSSYIEFEKQILASSGFGIDLEKCAVTGSLENLAYISPRSGRAVTKDIGLRYHNFLIPMPKKPSNQLEFLEWFDVLEAFLKKLFSFHNSSLPHSRATLSLTLEITNKSIRD